MMDIIRSDDRGAADHGWLKAKHTFSFADYHNPDMMNFGPLRVINEDRIAPAQGFGTHPHRDMEIVTYIIAGAIEHKDNMGNGSVIRAGDVQRMTAGTGVMHSEVNASSVEAAHLLQIWMLPEQNSLQPGYEQKHFSRDDKLDQWRLVGSREGRLDSLTIHQDIDLWAAVLRTGAKLEHSFGEGRRGFLQIVSGSISVAGHELSAGDGATVESESNLSISSTTETEMLLFDMG